MAAAALPATNHQQDVRQARHIEAGYFDSLRGFGDSEPLRLESLKSSLAEFLVENRKNAQFAELLLVPGEPARLWVDLVTSVVMEPDYRTYRVVQDIDSRTSVVLETTRREEVLRFLQVYLAERAVLPSRPAFGNAAESDEGRESGQWSTGFVIYAWLTGFVLGLLIILVAVNALK